MRARAWGLYVMKIIGVILIVRLLYFLFVLVSNVFHLRLSWIDLNDDGFLPLASPCVSPYLTASHCTSKSFSVHIEALDRSLQEPSVSSIRPHPANAIILVQPDSAWRGRNPAPLRHLLYGHDGPTALFTRPYPTPSCIMALAVCELADYD